MAEDPCERAERLIKAKDDIILGEKAVEIEHDSGIGEKRKVRYGQADLKALDREIHKAQTACAAKRSRPSRFSMVGG